MSEKICPSCGSTIPEDSIYCAYCHEQLVEESAADHSKDTPSEDQRKTNEKNRSNEQFQVMTDVNFNDEKTRLIPFIGDSASKYDDNKGLVHSIACSAANFDEFEILFQQRNKLRIKIEGGVLSEKQTMDGLRAFIYPDIKNLAYNKKDLMEIYVNTPITDTQIPENYGLIKYHKDNPINFGYILFSAPHLEFKDQIKFNSEEGEEIINKYVVPLISEISYDKALNNPIPTSLKSIDIDWENIKEKFMEDDQIKFHMFTKDEDEFRWEHPISLKIEIEDSIYSDLVNFETKKYKGASLLRGSRLDKVNLIISNTTYNQVFASDLENVQVSIKFQTNYRELIQPSALIINKKNAEYLMENGTIEWTPGDLKVREREYFSFLIDRDIIEVMDGFSIKVSGYYTDNPQVFQEYTYVTPMGFPVDIEKSAKDKIKSTNWNPGEIQTFKSPTEKKSKEEKSHIDFNVQRPFYKSSKCANYKKLESLKPTFSQEIFVSMSNLTKSLNKENYVQILKSSCEFISRLEGDIREMEGIDKITKKIIDKEGKNA